jgi:hypothetical protein
MGTKPASWEIFANRASDQVFSKMALLLGNPFSDISNAHLHFENLAPRE